MCFYFLQRLEYNKLNCYNTLCNIIINYKANFILNTGNKWFNMIKNDLKMLRMKDMKY